MGMLAKSLKHSIWYASKILHGTRYAEQNKEVRGTPWGEGGIASGIVLLIRTMWALFMATLSANIIAICSFTGITHISDKISRCC